MQDIDTVFNDLDTAKARKAQYKAGVTFARTNAIPLDKYSIFKSKADAITYVNQAEDNVAYPGQIIAVQENEYSAWAAGKVSTPEGGNDVTVPTFELTFADDTWTMKFSNGVTKTTAGTDSDLSATFTGLTEGDFKVPVDTSLTTSGYEVQFTRTYGATQNVYVLDLSSENGLKKINGTGSSSSGGSSGDVEAEKARAMATEKAISTALDLSVDMIETQIDGLSGVVDGLSNDVGYLSGVIEDLSAAAELSIDTTTTTAGALKSYTIKQGTRTVGTIDIPKDFLVKSGKVATAEADDTPITGIKKGEKYLDFTINVKEGSADDEHVYIAVKDLTDVYTGSEGTTVKVTVGADNSIGAEVIEGSIDTGYLKDGAVTTVKIADSAVTTAKIADSAVTTAKINNDAVTNDKIADNAVDTAQIVDSAVTTDKIKDGNVTTGKIALSAVTTDRIADDAVTNDKIAANAVDTEQLVASSVTEGKIADSAVTTNKINDLAVTTDKIGNKAVTTAKIADEAVGTDQLSASAVTTAKIADYAVTNDKIAADAVNTDQIADDAVTNTKIAADAVSTEQLSSKAVTTEKIADNAVGTDQIADNAVTHEKLGLSAITWDNLSSDVQEKIGEGNEATLSAAKKYTDEQISALDATITDETVSSVVTSIVEENGKLVSMSKKAIRITEDQVTNLTTDLKNLSDEISAVSGDMSAYVKIADFKTAAATTGFDRATASDKLTISSDVSAAIDAAIKNFDVAEVTATSKQTIKLFKEEDGKISVEIQDIDFSDYVPVSAAEAATGDDKLVKASTVSAEISAALSGLDLAEQTVGADKTLTFIKQEDGLVTTGVTSIQITEEQVTNLTTDLKNLSDEIIDISGDYVKKADVSDYSKITETNKIVISSDVSAAIDEAVKNIGTVLHFKGVDDVSKLDAANYKNGDVILDSATSKEYVVVSAESGNSFREIGDETSYVSKSTTVNGKALSTAITLDGTDLKVAGSGDYKDSTVQAAIDDLDGRLDKVELSVENLSGDLALSVSNLTADDDYLSTEIGKVELSVENLSDELGDLELSVENLSGDLALSVSNLTAADEYLSGQISALAENFLSGVTVNDVTATVENHVAHVELSASQIKWDITSIDCGNASLTE